MLLMTADSQAMFSWIHSTIERMDKQYGINCSVFRNEGPYLSSRLILMAEEFAKTRWPQESRCFTYIDADKIQSPNPGYCFKMAGWKTCGISKGGKILLDKIWNNGRAQ